MTKRTRDRADKAPDAISEGTVAVKLKALRKRHTTKAVCRAFEGEVDPRQPWRRIELWLNSGYRTADQIDATCAAHGYEHESEYVSLSVPSENEIARIHGRHGFREEPQIDAIFRQARKRERAQLRRRGPQLRARVMVNVCRRQGGREARVGGRSTSRRAGTTAARSGGRSKPGGDTDPGDLAGGSLDWWWSR